MSTQRLLVSIEIAKPAGEGLPDRVYTLSVPYGAPAGETFDVTTEMGKEIMEMARKSADAAKDAADKKAAESTPAADESNS